MTAGRKSISESLSGFNQFQMIAANNVLSVYIALFWLILRGCGWNEQTVGVNIEVRVGSKLCVYTSMRASICHDIINCVCELR